MIITVISGENVATRLEYSSPTTLFRAIVDSGVNFIAPCGGRGVCGKCGVTVVGGFDGSGENIEVLACKTVVSADTVISLPTGDVRAVTVGEDMLAGDDTSQQREVGFALDIGTTTLAAAAVDMKTGKILKSAAMQNPQAAHGADVISRISFDEENPHILRDEIRDATLRLKNRVGCEKDSPAVIVGNTTMLSLYSGLDVSGIGRYPFAPPSLFGESVGNEYIPPCVSGFVGADAISAYFAAGLCDGDDSNSALLLDIGTNGEMLYRSSGKLCCASAAAGPALEGAGISCGLPASDGAIDAVTISDGHLSYHVIGEKKARGLCGSGLIGAISCLIRLGAVRCDGYMEKDYEIARGVSITPADVRAFMLAKAAIRAGIEILTHKGEVCEVIISGGFGAGLNFDDMFETGILPRRFEGHVRYIGNGALLGASRLLCDSESRETVLRTARDAEYTELSASVLFADEFIKRLRFGD